ncbi:hypothetical protein [Synechococcus sp. CS-197]|uniref:hypothetical protein n=1 Tax=Synechococcus sp. CS-197 TaxID=2847985 RepID=UPI000152534A|nr:hypothetical protein [Synechococcus sp. CS-197]CAK23304.1 Conserved hypothetical protein [Synechococcus sp. WH 7803]
MSRQRFRGLYLQNTGHPLCFSFVTYTPQTREQMVACGDLRADEEYFSPVLFDFLLFVSEGILGASPGVAFPFGYDDLAIVASRIRGTGVQHEYLIAINASAWNESKQAVLQQLRDILSRDLWDGARLRRGNDHPSPSE